MLTLDQILNESRWVAKMNGWRQAGTYKELEHLSNDPDCREIDIAAEQPEHLREFFDMLDSNDTWMTIPEFYRTCYAPRKYDEEMSKLVDKVRDYLNENKLYTYDIRYADMDAPLRNCVVVEIVWGDWKHDHARCDWLVKQVGGTPEYTEVTNEDGSDCYSAIHAYRFS